MRALEMVEEIALSEGSEACIVCGGRLHRHARVFLAGSQLRECAVCGSWTCLPRQSRGEQTAIHDTEEYFRHPYFTVRRTAQLAWERRCRDAFTRIACGVDLRAVRGQRLLDVGCDTGEFLVCAARLFGVIPVGVDVASRAVAVATSRGLEAYQGCVEEVPDHVGDFEVVTAIDLIEHVTAPRAFLRAVCKKLRPGGVAYLETPNVASAVYRVGRILRNLTGGRPARLFERLFPPQHVQYFTVKGLSFLASASGLEVVDIRTRLLAWPEIAAALPVRAAIAGIQAIDQLTNHRILMCAVLRRPCA